MSYAIRFLPVDPSDPSPALYLSRQRGVRFTALASDLLALGGPRGPVAVAFSKRVKRRCARDRLQADVVPLAEALRDLADDGQPQEAP